MEIGTVVEPGESLETVVRQEVARRQPKGIVAKKQRVIAVCTPTMGQVSMWWCTSLMDTIWPVNCGKAILPMVDDKGGEIAEMRNRCVQVMLAAENENLEIHSILWLDDDVIANRAIILSLASHDADIAAGVYFTKLDPGGEPLIFGGPSSGTMPFLPGEVFPAWGWAQGLSLVRMDVFKRVRDELDIGKDKYGAPLWYEPADFKVDQDTGQIMSGGTEDFPFFAKCNKLGYKAIIDCRREAFGFHYDTVAKQGYPKKQWGQFYKREPIIWPSNRHHEEIVWR